VYLSLDDLGRVSRIDLKGYPKTYAGKGRYADDYGVDGGPALEASLTAPSGLAVGPRGSLYIADKRDNRVRRVTPRLQEMGVGIDVPVVLYDVATGAGPVTLTFPFMPYDQAPTLSLVTRSTGVAAPEGSQLTDPSVYYELGLTATTTHLPGPIPVCVDYSRLGAASEAGLKLYSLENGEWVDCTTSVDTEANVACGSLDSQGFLDRMGQIPQFTLTLMETVPSGAPNPDFDGSGKVDFPDFLIFAGVFMKSVGDAGYDARCDLTGDGTVGFPDFVEFATAFGNVVGKPTRAARPLGGGATRDNTRAALSLRGEPSEAGDELAVVLHAAEAGGIQAYCVKLQYDDALLELVSASQQRESLFVQQDGPRAVSLQLAAVPGEVVLADALQPAAVLRGDGDLARLVFRVRDDSLPGTVAITSATVAGVDGAIHGILAARLEGLVPLPPTYALGPNTPNPFNPATQIAYQLPEGGQTWLCVYNVLGQRVRVLVRERQEAGYYRATWDGADEYGRPVSSGVYLCRLESGSFAQTRRMLLLK